MGSLQFSTAQIQKGPEKGPDFGELPKYALFQGSTRDYIKVHAMIAGIYRNYGVVDSVGEAVL